MCDTFVALSDTTANGSALLAKSGDTEVTETAQIKPGWPVDLRLQ